MKVVYLLSFLIVLGCAAKQVTPPPPATPVVSSIEEAVQSPYRTPKNIARDQYRHPVETLKFFGITPDMTVVEITPGGGWYMEILAPLLHEKGQYIGAVSHAQDSEHKEFNAHIHDWMQAHPSVSDKMKFVEFSAKHTDLGIEGTADAVVTFRNIHNWMSEKAEKKAFKSFFKALKPGGILGVVEHRANAKKKQDPKAKSGYVREDYVIRIAQKAGFKLVEKSEINANSKDTKNYPNGVWTLPPSYKLGDKDHDKYAQIGESDRMTLKFIKPAAKK